MIKTNFSVLMAERGLKISDVYEGTGISKTTLMALAENTGKGIQFETVDKLCTFLNVTPCEFFLYVPYTYKLEYIENKKDNKTSTKISEFTIKLEKQYYKKVFYIQVLLLDPYDEFFPLGIEEGKNYKGYITLDVEDTDSYDLEEFYDFYNNLPVSFKSDFIAEIKSTIENEFKKLIGEKLTLMGWDKEPFKKGDKFLFHLFAFDTEYDNEVMYDFKL